MNMAKESTEGDPLNMATSVSHTRIRFVDVAKGIGVLLMILHHCIARAGTAYAVVIKIAGFILSFHMPLFFFLSGYVYRNKDTRAFFAERISGLLLPVLAFQALNMAISIVLDGLNCVNPLGILFSGFWFVYSVLYASCVFHLVDRFLKDRFPSRVWAGHIIVEIGMFLFAYRCSRLVSGTEDSLATAATGYVFFSAGAAFRRIANQCTFLLKVPEKGRCAYAVVGVLLTGILWITSGWNQQILMYISSYGSWRWFLMNAFIGIAAVYFISMAIDQCAWLEFFGRNSLVIMITHFPVYTFVLMTLQEYLRDSAVLIAATFLITLVIEVPVAYFADRYLPLLTGKYLKK